ncbi:MAG: SDR family oxidoreductase [Neomegalonema sp.]|nr:SDR family oxidoreductase [Neomegalonema sp.]
MANLNGKTALITGASRGIGAAAARSLAKAGAKVVLAARSAQTITELAQRLDDEGHHALAIPCDVANYQSVEAAMRFTQDSFGSVDIVVNNAGVIEPIARIEDSDPLSWDLAIDINVKGVYHGVRAALPIMQAQGSGTIVNISSGAATSALEGWSHYCASKAAVLSLTRVAHKELAGSGIRVIGLSPGTVATDMQVAIKASGINPVSQLDPNVHIPPDWVGKAIAWCCTDDAQEFDGDDVRLRDEEIRRRVGLI